VERLMAQVLDELNVKRVEVLSSEEIAAKLREVALGKSDYEVSSEEIAAKLWEVALGKPDYEVSSEGGYAVAVPTEVSPELKAEGLAREIVHRLQIMRRSAGFDIADYVVTHYQGDDYLKQVIDDFADYIKQETLSRRLIEGIPEEGVFTENHSLGGCDILLGVKRLA
jgi:isoleucyl-tRNA synthetase